MTGVRLHIAVTFWGEQYRRYFIDLCLASLLAPENIPAIGDKGSARLLIATTDADWQAMQLEPIFQAARTLISIEHVAYEVDSAGMSRHQIMLAMSGGHRRLADRMFEDRAYGIFVYPDSIIADGGIARLQQLARDGVKVVMCLAVRFANEGLVEELKHAGLLRHAEPLIVDTIGLARMSIAHMHSETCRFDFNANAWDYGSSAYFWTVTPGKNLVFHTSNWAPMLINYGALAEHDTSTFDRWTLDGDYIQRNFTDRADFYIVQNTRELFITSFTPESQSHYSVAPFLLYRFGWLRNWLKFKFAHHFLVTRRLFDPLKLEHIRLPIRMQGDECSEADWRRVERQSAAVIGKILGDSPGPFDGLVNFGFKCMIAAYLRFRLIARGDVNAKVTIRDRR